MAFEPIMTEEALEGVMRTRINRLNEKHEKERAEDLEKIKDYDDLKAKIAEYEAGAKESAKALEDAKKKDAKIAELEGSIKKYESDSLKTKLALSAHLKPDAWKYISGNTEDEIKESIAGLNDLLKGAGSAPSGSSEDAVTKEGANRANELAQLKALRGGES